MTSAHIAMPEAPHPPDPTPDDGGEAWSDDVDPSLPTEAIAIDDADAPDQEDWEDDLDWEEEPVDTSPPTSQAMSTREALAWLAPLWRKGLASWRRLLAGVRSRVPAAANLSDGILSGILLGGLVILFVLFNAARGPAVASGPSPSRSPVSSVETPAPATASPEAPPSPTTAAEPAQPAPDPAERDRIVNIQTQLTAGAFDDESGLIESVEADFTHNRLTANLSGAWYGLSAAEQTTLADSLLQRSTQMSFERLEVRSPDGNLLARSPVVGNQIVILQRVPPPEVEAPPRPLFRITVDR